MSGEVNLIPTRTKFRGGQSKHFLGGPVKKHPVFQGGPVKKITLYVSWLEYKRFSLRSTLRMMTLFNRQLQFLEEDVLGGGGSSIGKALHADIVAVHKYPT